MLKGKHIMITLLIIGLSWLNWFVYTTCKSISDGTLSGNEGVVGFCVFLITIQCVILLIVIIWNWSKIWNWEFNLNKWICKLKH